MNKLGYAKAGGRSAGMREAHSGSLFSISSLFSFVPFILSSLSSPLSSLSSLLSSLFSLCSSLVGLPSGANYILFLLPLLDDV